MENLKLRWFHNYDSHVMVGPEINFNIFSNNNYVLYIHQTNLIINSLKKSLFTTEVIIEGFIYMEVLLLKNKPKPPIMHSGLTCDKAETKQCV